MNTKITIGVIFNLQNSHLMTLSLPTEEVLRVNGQNRSVANLTFIQLRTKPREMPSPKPLDT